MAEWSKALVLGTSPKGREFEPHFVYNFPNFDSLAVVEVANVHVDVILLQKDTSSSAGVLRHMFVGQQTGLADRARSTTH